jgi:hypothetical protein
MKTPDKKTIIKEAAIWNSVKTLLESASVKTCNK